MIARRRLGWLALAGAGLVVAARAVIPWAPPLYDGPITTAPPYAYVSPPPNLASTNQQPTGGDGDVQLVNGVSQTKTIETTDSQLLVFFNEGLFKLPGTVSLHIRITPERTLPPPPPGTQYVGNVYCLEAVLPAGVAPSPGSPLDTTGQPSFAMSKDQALMSAQVLLRVPPLPYNNVRLGYGGAWYTTQWGAQADSANVTIDHLGCLAAFLEAGKPKPKTFPTGIVEAAVTALAIAVVLVGIMAQLRRRISSD